jgi:hypothetical protein
MIIEWMLKLGLTIIDVLFVLTGALPAVPEGIENAVDSVFNFMFSGVNLLSIFLDMNVVKVLIPIVIGVINFDNIAKLVMFILKKVPVVNIK